MVGSSNSLTLEIQMNFWFSWQMVALIRGPERASWLAKDRLLVVTFQMYGRFLPTFTVKKIKWMSVCINIYIYII